MTDIRKGSRKYYKGSYFIVFYDKHDNYLQYMFDNVREILEYMHKPVTRQNVNIINNEIYRALKSTTHMTRFLNNELLRVYIINLD